MRNKRHRSSGEFPRISKKFLIQIPGAATELRAASKTERRDRGPVVKLDINQADPSLSSFDRGLVSFSLLYVPAISRVHLFLPSAMADLFSDT